MVSDPLLLVEIDEMRRVGKGTVPVEDFTALDGDD